MRSLWAGRARLTSEEQNAHCVRMADDPESVTSAAASTPVEIELKLATDAEGLAALSDAPELDGRSSVRRLDSTYFDTKDRRLTARGITLRVRKIGRRFVQTIKTAGPDRVRAIAFENRCAIWFSVEGCAGIDVF